LSIHVHFFFQTIADSGCHNVMQGFNSLSERQKKYILESIMEMPSLSRTW